MTKNEQLQTVYLYHEISKHSQQRYARSLGYMDWTTQPDAFREYKGAAKTLLPLALDNATPPYMLLDEPLPAAPLCTESLSQFLQLSMGIAAWKESGGSRWAVRCNASSGNLHPTEAYLILPKVEKLCSEDMNVFHYAPKEHAIEKLAECKSDFFTDLPDGSFLVALSSIAWREMWKYGERAFRYVHLDIGHAYQSLAVSAKLLGWKLTRLENLDDLLLDRVLGLNQKERFFEEEHADMLCLVSPQACNKQAEITPLLQNLPKTYAGIANKLSPAMHEWEMIPKIIAATTDTEIPKPQTKLLQPLRTPTKTAKEVILQRRSVHVMNKEISRLTQEQFHTILSSVNGSLEGDVCATHLCIFLHQVEEYEAGLYILLRNNTHKEDLKTLMHNDFLWEETALRNLYLLKKDDYTFASKAISCSQDIASEGSFSLGMLCDFTNSLNIYGPHRYKELYWECGAIGQQLYLEATSLGCSGTGIGCFLDDTMHSLLGLKSNRFQILYHFTVGRGFVDSRIQTKPAYEKRSK